MSCRAEPIDVEDATTAAAVSSVAMATTATAVAASPPPEQPLTAVNNNVDGVAMVSGPRLPQAVSEATASEAEMIAVPISEQLVMSLPGPGINAAFLSASSHLPTAAADEGTTAVNDKPILVQSRTASVVATKVIAAGAAVEPANTAGLSTASMASAVAAVTSTVVSGSSNGQNAITAMHVSTSSVSQLTQQSESVSAAAMMPAESSEGFESGKADLSVAEPLLLQHAEVAGQQPTEAEPAKGMQDDCSNMMVASLSSEQIRAQQSFGYHHAGLQANANGDGVSGHELQIADSQNEDVPSLKMSGTSLPLLSVKQSVMRLEQLHADMRSKA